MISRLRYWCLVWLVLFYGKTSAQQKYAGATRYPIFTLRTNPLSALERDGNLGLGIGYQPFPSWAFTLEPAYIFFSTHNDKKDLSSLSGIKLRADVRYYLKSGARGLFIGPEFHYKKVSNDEVADFGFNCVGGQCAFFQQATYKRRKRELGLSLKMGTDLKISGKLSAELFIGLGVKNKKFIRNEIPNGGIFLTDPDRQGFAFINTDQDGNYYMIPAGIKLLYYLR